MHPDYVIHIANQGKDWVDIMSALLTPTIAALGIYLGLMQWRINKYRLTNELFEKRWGIYMAAQNLIKNTVFIQSKITKEAFGAEEPDFVSYLNAISGARFVFDESVYSFLFKLIERSTKIKKKGALKKYISISEEIDNMLGPFMMLRMK